MGDEIAERLLVAEHEAQLRPLRHDLADPLETRERLLRVHPGRFGHAPSSDDDTIVVTTSRSSPAVLARM